MSAPVTLQGETLDLSRPRRPLWSCFVALPNSKGYPRCWSAYAPTRDAAIADALAQPRAEGLTGRARIRHWTPSGRPLPPQVRR